MSAFVSYLRQAKPHDLTCESLASALSQAQDKDAATPTDEPTELIEELLSCSFPSSLSAALQSVAEREERGVRAGAVERATRALLYLLRPASEYDVDAIYTARAPQKQQRTDTHALAAQDFAVALLHTHVLQRLAAMTLNQDLSESVSLVHDLTVEILDAVSDSSGGAAAARDLPPHIRSKLLDAAGGVGRAEHTIQCVRAFQHSQQQHCSTCDDQAQLATAAVCSQVVVGLDGHGKSVLVDLVKAQPSLVLFHLCVALCDKQERESKRE